MYRNSILYIVMVVIILSIVIIPTTLFDVMLENDVNGNYESAAIEAKRLDKIFDMTANQDELSALNIF